MSTAMTARLAGACVLGLSALVPLSPAVSATTPSTRLVVGGAEYAKADRLVTTFPFVAQWVTPSWDIGVGFFPGTDPVVIDYPASLFGKGTANAHINAGADNLDAAIKNRLEPLAVAGQSEGSVVLDAERARLESDPAAPARDQLQFVLFNSPTRGLTTTLFRDGTRIPFVDITVAPPPESRYDTSVVIHEYDFWADFPDRPWNLLTLINAGASTVFDHTLAYDAPSDVPPQDITTVVNSKGATDTTYFVPAAELPLTEALRVAGVPDKAVDNLDKAIRPMIDAGYSRNDKPGDPRPYLAHGILTTHPKPTRTTAAPAASSEHRRAKSPAAGRRGSHEDRAGY